MTCLNRAEKLLQAQETALGKVLCLSLFISFYYFFVLFCFVVVAVVLSQTGFAPSLEMFSTKL